MPFDALALDAGARSYDRDSGHLHVRVSHVSKACVNPYRGGEIPRAEALGLDLNRVYQLLRDPEELARSVPTWNGLPLMIRHRPQSADDHERDVVVGALGTDAAFHAPYLDNSLVIWDGEGIAGVESDELRQLSGGYHYDADMTPGTWNGQAYDGVMRNIRGNHVALVEAGRAGNDVLVMDSAMDTAKGKIMTKKAAAAAPRKTAARKVFSPAVAMGALQVYLPPRMAKDAKLPDLDRLLRGAKPGEIASRVRVAMKPLLAADASLEDLDGLIDHLKGPQMQPDGGETMAENPDDTGLGDPEGTNEPALSEDDDLEEKIRELLAGKLDDADMEMLMKLIRPAEEDMPPPPEAAVPPDDAPPAEAAPPPPDDAPPPDDKPSPFPPKKDDDAKDRGGWNRGKDALPPALKENMVDKPAMDAAIKAASAAAVADAIKETTRRLNARADAERFVRPWIGEVTVAMDTADDVYRTALDALGVDVKDVHPSAFRTILAHLPKPGDARPRMGMDSAGVADFAARFPGASRLRVVG